MGIGQMAEQPQHDFDDGSEQIALAAAYSELQNLLLEASDVTAFLDQVVHLAAGVVPATACSVTMRRDHSVTTAASSHGMALAVDEIQYGRGQGPCLHALRTGRPVPVPDMSADDRWPDYRPHALAHGVASSLSLPLTVEGSTLGALNIYGSAVAQFDGTPTRRAEAFAAQIVTALRIVMHQARQTTLEKQLRQALAARAVIDQAIGMIAGQQHIPTSAAFALLREASQHRNMKLGTLAAEIIEAISGHPYQPPSPFTER
jgi:GAF domain-containing protein